MIEYILKRSNKRKRLSIEINYQKEITVRAPSLLPQKKIDKFIVENRDWIEKKLKEIEHRNEQLQNFKQDSVLYFLGKKFSVKFEDIDKELVFQKSCIIFNNSIKEHYLEIYYNYIYKIAYHLLKKRVEILAKQYKFQYSDFRLTKAKTMWGNCNYLNVIRINWRLIMAPLSIIDYVIVHELSHTEYKNHKKVFWNRVERAVPYYKNARKFLKEQGRLYFDDRFK